MIDIKRVELDWGACNACDRGRLAEDGRRLAYPYSTVLQIRLDPNRNSVGEVRVCDECASELVAKLMGALR